MMKRHFSAKIFATAVFSLSLNGCFLPKNSPVSSGAKSVDDAVRTTDEQNSSLSLCGDSNRNRNLNWDNIRKNGSKLASGKSYDAIMSVLQRVPRNLMNKLSENQMEITLYNGEPEACKNLSWIKTSQKDQRKFYICYDVEIKNDIHKLKIHVGSIDDRETLSAVLDDPDVVAQMKALNINSLDATELVLRNELIRTIGLYFVRHPRNALSSILSVTPQSGTYGSGSKKINLGLTKKISKMADEALDKLNRQRTAILDALYLDIEKLSNGDQVKKSFEKIRSAMVSEERFDDELLADVFDSYFCSAKSLSRLESRFGRTKTAFENNFAVDL